MVAHTWRFSGSLTGLVDDPTRTAMTTRLLVALLAVCGGSHDLRKYAEVFSCAHTRVRSSTCNRVGSNHTIPTPRPGVWHLDDHRESEHRPHSAYRHAAGEWSGSGCWGRRRHTLSHRR